MSVTCFSTPTFLCKCDRCGRIEHVEKNYDKNYNGAQAVRSLGWSFGKDKTVKCDRCRRASLYDNYKHISQGK